MHSRRQFPHARRFTFGNRVCGRGRDLQRNLDRQNALRKRDVQRKGPDAQHVAIGESFVFFEPCSIQQNRIAGT